MLVIPCQHHTHELPAKHVTRLVSGRKTTGVGETIFIDLKNKNEEMKEELHQNNPIQYKTFNWQRYAGTCVESLARRIIAWCQMALANNVFSRGDYRYSVKLVLMFFGVEVPGFILERPKDTSPARFLAHGIYYLEMFLTLNLACIYEMLTGPQREEIILLSMYTACYYIPSMISSKFAEKTPSIVLDLVCELTKLKEVHPDIANCALNVVGRHLEPLSGEMAIFSLADDDLPAAEREEVGRTLWLLGSDPEIWQPGQMEIRAVEVPPIISDQSIIEERPQMQTFINSRSLLLLDLLGWTRRDLEVFSTPFDQWSQSEKFKDLLNVIKGMQVVNDIAERYIKMVKDFIKLVRTEHGLQGVLLAIDLVRERRGHFVNSNFNNEKLKKNVKAILDLS